MKKYLILTTSILLLAAACNNQQSAQVQPAQNPSAQHTQAATTVDTISWKTYANKQYGFELKYPSTWIFCDNKDKACNGGGNQNDLWVADVYRFCDNIVPPGTLNGKKTVAYCNNPHLAIVIGKSSQSSPALPVIKANYNQQQDISIGGVEGTEFSMATQDSKVFVVTKDAYTYQITSPQFPDDKNLVKIVSTFKFTK